MLAMRPSTRLIFQSFQALDAANVPLTIEQITEHSAFSRRTVERAIKDLESEAKIERQHQTDRRRFHYKIKGATT